jgi:hypothetical protein
MFKGFENWVEGHQNFGCKELEECGIKWGRMAGNSEEGQGPQRAVAPMMMMMMMYITICLYSLAKHMLLQLHVSICKTDNLQVVIYVFYYILLLKYPLKCAYK